MEELHKAGLTPQKVLELLGLEVIPGGLRQIDRFRRWIERLVRNRGEAYIRENRTEILRQWDQYEDSEFKSCV
jgi:hypothetical protein